MQRIRKIFGLSVKDLLDKALKLNLLLERDINNQPDFGISLSDLSKYKNLLDDCLSFPDDNTIKNKRKVLTSQKKQKKKRTY